MNEQPQIEKSTIKESLNQPYNELSIKYIFKKQIKIPRQFA